MPTLLAPFERCDLFGLSDVGPKKAADYLAPAAKPTEPIRFPGGFPAQSALPHRFPGREAQPHLSEDIQQTDASPELEVLPQTGKDHLVILVHGIQDIARWQSEIRDTLEKYGFLVELTNYDRMNYSSFYYRFHLFIFVQLLKILCGSNSGMLEAYTKAIKCQSSLTALAPT